MVSTLASLPDVLRGLWLNVQVLVVGGIVALQYATIVMGLPFAIVMVLVMIGLHRALEAERTQTTAARLSLASHLVGREGAHQGSWRRRVANTLGTVSLKRANQRLASVVVPALQEVADAMTDEGRTATVEVHDGGPDRPGSARLVVGEGAIVSSSLFAGLGAAASTVRVMGRDRGIFQRFAGRP